MLVNTKHYMIFYIYFILVLASINNKTKRLQKTSGLHLSTESLLKEINHKSWLTCENRIVFKDRKWKKCLLTFSTTDNKSKFGTDGNTDNFMVMAREDSSRCRIVTCKGTAAVSHYRPVAGMKRCSIKLNVKNSNHCLVRAFISCVTMSRLLNLSDPLSYILENIVPF